MGSSPITRFQVFQPQTQFQIGLQPEERDDCRAEIHRLLKIGDYQLELRDYLHPDLAEPLEQIAAWIGATPAAMLVTLLPVAASLLRVGTELEIDAGMGFAVPLIIFTGLVTPAGSKKSPIQRQILGPLSLLQVEANQEYEYAASDYEVDLREWEQKQGRREGPSLQEVDATGASHLGCNMGSDRPLQR
ncbi:MAG TPA: DUF3987 domain-containing protein [Candidatus Obscuribacterales bacterium]